MLSHDLNVKDFKLPVDGKSGTGGLWMTYVVPPVLLNQGYSPPCKFGYTIYVMLTNSCRKAPHHNSDARPDNNPRMIVLYEL